MPKAKSKKRAKRQHPSPRHAEPTTHASLPIKLPLDVLRQICGFSSNNPNTHANLARSCKDLYDMATPTLYADVHLKSDEQVGRLLDPLADEAVGKALRIGAGRVTRSRSKEALSSAQKAAIARLELLQSTTKITFEFIPHHTTCDKLRVTTYKLCRSSLCEKVSTMLFVSPLAEEIHQKRNMSRHSLGSEPLRIDCLGHIVKLARPTHICFRYMTVPSECNCISALVERFMDHGMDLQKVSVHAEAVDLRDHRIWFCGEERMDFEVFLADKTREAYLATHLSRFAESNRPYEFCDHDVAIKIVTPECDIGNLKQEMDQSSDNWIKNGLQLSARSKSNPCKVCGDY